MLLSLFSVKNRLQVAGGGGGDLNWPNRPVGLTTLVDTDFDDFTLPTAEGAAVTGTGADGWYTNNGGGRLSIIDESGDKILRAAFPGTGGGGGGVGIIYHDYPASHTRFYIGLKLRHPAGAELNGISNKLFYLEPGNIILESYENGPGAPVLIEDVSGGNWLSVYDGTLAGTMYRSPATTALSIGAWDIIEWIVTKGSGAGCGFQVYLNGVLVNSRSGAMPAPGGYGELKYDTTWGGGLNHTQAWNRDVAHIIVATGA